MPDFAALREQLNADTIDHLADVTVCAGSVQFRAIFRDEFVETLDAVATTRPVATCRQADACTVEVDDELVINQTLYRVAVIEPDNAGMLRLILEKTG